MHYEHIVIIDNQDKTSEAVTHFNNAALGEAIQYYRDKFPGSDGACLVYTGKAWRFIGYLRDIIV